MQICTPLSPSLEIFCPVMIKVKYMYTTTRSCTQLSWIFSKGESKHVNDESLYEHHQNPQLILAYFHKSRERTRMCVCDMENFYAMPMHLFFYHLDPSLMKSYGLVLITNVISQGSGEPMPLCNLVRVSLLTNSKFWSGWILRPKKPRHLHTPTN